MSAIRPNKNFDNEHKEHVPYKQITPASMLARYNELMKSVFGIYDDENAIAQMLALLAQGQKLQGGESEAYYDEETETLVINATAICFPMLVHEDKGTHRALPSQECRADFLLLNQTCSRLN